MNYKENRWTDEELRDLGKADAFLEEGRRILRAVEAKHSANAIRMRLLRMRRARAEALGGGAK